MFADQRQDEPRIHDWEGNVRLAVADMQVASWNPYRVMPSFWIQVNAHHLDAAHRRQV